MVAHGDGDWVWPDNGDGEEGKVRRDEKKGEKAMEVFRVGMRWVGCLVC